MDDTKTRNKLILDISTMTGELKDIYETKSTKELQQLYEKYKKKMKVISFEPCDDDKKLDSMLRYTSYGWINGKVLQQYIITNNDIYYYNNSYIEVDKEKWYKPTIQFYRLISLNRKTIGQTDTTMYVVLKNKKINFRIGYLVVDYIPMEGDIFYDMGNNKYFIIQNEQLFRNEEVYLKFYDTTEGNDYIKKELLKFVSEKSIDIAKNELSKAFNTIGISDEKIVDTIISELTKNLVLNMKLFQDVAQLIVYINPTYLPESKIFRHRLINNYYIPNMIHQLSIYEKFPELYENNVNVKMVDKIYHQIDKNVYNIIINMTKRLLNLSEDYNDVYKIDKFDIKNRLERCYNKKDIDKNIPEHKIIFYRDNDGDKDYCFIIDILHKNFSDKNFINSYTGKMFTNDFIKKVLSFNIQHTENENYQEEKEEKQKEKEEKEELKNNEDLFPDFWDIITKDIKSLEKEISGEDDDEDEDEDDEKDEEKDDEKDMPKEEKQRGDEEILQEEKCNYCKNNLQDDNLKTIIYKDGVSSIAKFCCMKCFENQDKWPKPCSEKYKNIPKKSKKQLKKEFDQISLKTDRIMLPKATIRELVQIADDNNIKIPAKFRKDDKPSKDIYDKLGIDKKQQDNEEKMKQSGKKSELLEIIFKHFYPNEPLIPENTQENISENGQENKQNEENEKEDELDVETKVKTKKLGKKYEKQLKKFEEKKMTKLKIDKKKLNYDEFVKEYTDKKVLFDMIKKYGLTKPKRFLKADSLAGNVFIQLYDKKYGK